MRQACERLLIVCEGSKTEPQYLNEIKRDYRLATANVQVLHSPYGTDPQSVLDYALTVFRNGDAGRGVEAGAFDRIVVVFDRDEHSNYHAALDRASRQDRRLKNDAGEAVPLQVVASVPCFELWLLLHFDEIRAPLHRHEALARLKRHLPGYEKGGGGHWAATRIHLPQATARAEGLAQRTTAYDGTEPYTAMHELVARLIHLKDGLPA